MRARTGSAGHRHLLVPIPATQKCWGTSAKRGSGSPNLIKAETHLNNQGTLPD